MTVRVVEGKKPYTGGTAIEITEDKVINLLLREANNLLQVNGNNELFCDLQLNDELRPTDDFPVGVTTGRIIEDNGWDWDGTILCAKTTSGDNIKLIYTDAGEIWVDNGTGTFKQMYLASEVDSLLALKQDVLTAGNGISIDSNNEISNTLPGAVVSDTAPTDPIQGDMWYDTTSDELKTYDGSQWNTAGGGGSGGGTEVSTTEPVNPSTGLMWYNPSNQILKLFDGTYWVSFGEGTVIIPLPTGYQEVEYIQNTGSEWIDTGVAVTSGTTSLDMKYNILNQIVSGEFWALAVWSGSAGFRTGENRGTFQAQGGLSNDASGYNTDITCTGIATMTTDRNMFLFAQNEGSTTPAHYNEGICRVYYCDIYESGVKVRSLVPCTRDSDGAVGMYDKVNDVFYTNLNSTGGFIAGPDV